MVARRMPSTRRPPRLLVVGSVAFDRLERDDRSERRLGGVVTYGGLTAARLGCAVEAWSALPASRAAVVRQLLAPIALHLSPSAAPTRFLNRERAGHERDQRCPTQARTLAWVDRPFAADAAWDWVHLGPLHGADLAADLGARLRPHCRVLSVDLQGYARRISADGAVVAEVVADIDRRLAGVDWVKASDAEWAQVAAALGLDAAAARARFGWQGLLVTRGAAGGTAHLACGEIGWSAAPVESVALETGAGDVFVTALVAGLITAGADAAAGPQPEVFREVLAEAARIAARHVAGDWLDLAALALPDPAAPGGAA